MRATAGYHEAMMSTSSWPASLGGAARAPLRWALSWVGVLHFAATLLVLTFSPSSYNRTTRLAIMRHTYLDTAPLLWGFTLLCALLTLVTTRIVVVTAYSYGLSRYAMEMIIRVLVLELIPLTAALFVAMRCTIPHGAALAEMRRQGRFAQRPQHEAESMVHEVLPRMLAGIFSTVTLAALSCVVATVLAYLAVFGFTTAGLPAYNRMFGHVFNLSVSLIFVLKTLLFSLTVSTLPMATGRFDPVADGSHAGAALQGLVRMFAVLLLLEGLSLMGNYY